MDTIFCSSAELVIKLSMFEPLGLKILYQAPEDRKRIWAHCSRPGLLLAGFGSPEHDARIQILGHPEMAYLLNITETDLAAVEGVRRFMESVPLCVVTNGQAVPEKIISLFASCKVTVTQTPLTSARALEMIREIIKTLPKPHASVHGVFVEVFGLGVLIQGKPGIGKSEAAVELLQRGHRLIADDLVLVQETMSGEIEGFPAETNRHIMEIRGIGFIDVQKLYGIGAVRERKRIEIVISLHSVDVVDDNSSHKKKTEHINILGADLPFLQLPVRPGRNVPILIEVVAMNYRAELLGFDTYADIERRHMSLLKG